MKKGLLVVLLLIMITSVSYAEEVVVVLPDFDVLLNGSKIENIKEPYPFIHYKDITYMPLTWEMAAALGLQVIWSDEEGLKVNKATESVAYDSDLGAVNVLKRRYKAGVIEFPVEVNGKTVDQAAEFPLLNYKNITYFPMTYDYMVDAFDTNLSFDTSKGLQISVDPSLPVSYPLPLTFDYVVEAETLRDKEILITDHFILKKAIEGIGYQLLINLNHDELNGQVLNVKVDYFDEYGRYDYTTKLVSGMLYQTDHNGRDVYMNTLFLPAYITRIEVQVELIKKSTVLSKIETFKQLNGVTIEIVHANDITKIMLEQGEMKYMLASGNRCMAYSNQIDDRLIAYAAMEHIGKDFVYDEPVNIVTFIEDGVVKSMKNDYVGSLAKLSRYDAVNVNPYGYMDQFEGLVGEYVVDEFFSSFIYLYDENKLLQRMVIVRDILE